MWHDWFRVRIEKNVPYDQIVKGILTASSLDGKKPDEWIEQVKKIDDGRQELRHDRIRQARNARPVLAAAAAGADHRVGREGRGRVPGRAPRMRPVPQAPDRPLDPGRLPGVRQPVRAASTRRTTSSPHRTSRNSSTTKIAERERRSPPRRTTISAIRSARCSSHSNRDARCMLSHPDTNTVAAAQGAGRAGVQVRTRQGRPRRPVRRGCARRTTRSSPAASSIASGRTTSASGWSTRSTTSRSPTRRPTPACSTRWPRTSSNTTTTSGTSSGRSCSVGPIRTASTPNETNRFDKVNFARSYVRPMMAEVVVDVVNDALGDERDVPGRQ